MHDIMLSKTALFYCCHRQHTIFDVPVLCEISGFSPVFRVIYIQSKSRSVSVNEDVSFPGPN